MRIIVTTIKRVFRGDGVSALSEGYSAKIYRQ